MIRLFQMLLLAFSFVGFASAPEEDGNGRGWFGLCCRRRVQGAINFLEPELPPDIKVVVGAIGRNVDFSLRNGNIVVDKSEVDGRYIPSPILDPYGQVTINLAQLVPNVPKTVGAMIFQDEDGNTNAVKIIALLGEENRIRIMKSAIEAADPEVKDYVKLDRIVETMRRANITKPLFDRIGEQYRQKAEDEKIAFLEETMRNYGAGRRSDSPIPEALISSVAIRLKTYFDATGVMGPHNIRNLLKD